ncbi:MAG TPA: ATP-grasp domain-containing protein [bacterium]|nr:ATP-grasp domain-containing protein [bacterium]
MSDRLIALLHNPIPPDARPDDADLIEEIRAVSGALHELGRPHATVVFDTDLSRVRRELDALRPEAVFNLVESFDGKGALQYLAPALLEQWGFRYTGGTAESLFLTTDKLLAKEFFTLKGIPTPDLFATGRCEQMMTGARYIVKPVDEDASLGIGPDSIIAPANAAELRALIERKDREHGVRHFAEQFIDGREFNLTVLGLNGAPQVLSPAEIQFIGFGDTRPKIVDYRAKWDENSFECENTRRSFDLPPEDAPLLARLADIAVRCWRDLRLAGYARVDLRVDGAGTPWVLEVNVNPCIAPDGGVAAACARDGIGYAAFIERVLAEALR